MTPLLFALIAVAGGLGAATRFILDGAIRRLAGARFPFATVTINVTGSLLLGLVTGLAIGGVLPHEWQLVAGTGFLGGYTTFSTASFETVRLLQEKRAASAVLNGLGTLVVATLAAAVGLLLGGLA